jgi:hypothetical protein
MIYTAIVFFKDDSRPVKYRNIKGAEKFERFVMSKFNDNLAAINFYNKETRGFVKQVKF